MYEVGLLYLEDHTVLLSLAGVTPCWYVNYTAVEVQHLNMEWMSIVLKLSLFHRQYELVTKHPDQNAPPNPLPSLVQEPRWTTYFTQSEYDGSFSLIVAGCLTNHPPHWQNKYFG